MFNDFFNAYLYTDLSIEVFITFFKFKEAMRLTYLR